MSRRYKGGVISATAPTTSTSAASGSWSEQQTLQGVYSGNWPRSPGAPTIGTATAGTTACASVTFSAPSCVGTGSLTYKVISTPGCYQNTGSSSPVVVSGLTSGTSYTFKAYGVTPGGTGPASSSSNSITAVLAGSQSYTAAGTYTWVAPCGVTSVSVVTVGAGGKGGNGSSGSYPGIAGGGGALAYVNNITVIPGNSYAVNVPSQNTSSYNSSKAYFCSTSVVAAGSGGGGYGAGTGGCGGTVVSGTGGSGGKGGRWCASYSTGSSGGGGAGGYSGSGGRGGGGAQGGPCNTLAAHSGVSGSGGGGGGGSGTTNTALGGGGGGGVGLFGSGSNGSGGTYGSSTGVGGAGGSSGTAGGDGKPCGSQRGKAGNGGFYGGGAGGGSPYSCCGYGVGGIGICGAVRIVWPGNTRQFPSTCVGSP